MNQNITDVDPIKTGLLFILNDYLRDSDIYLENEDCFYVTFNLWDTKKMYSIINTFKFKEIGNSYDYPNILPVKTTFDDSNIRMIYSKYEKIAISEKYNAIILYTEQRYKLSIACVIDNQHYRKFNKKLNEILDADTNSGLFNNTNFSYKKNEFIEISESVNDDDKLISVQRKKVPKETLIFDKRSNLYNVIHDIELFFDKDTKKIYKEMKILYKRGCILYGDPGNGKTAMIREIIRKISNAITIVINSNTPKIIFILSELINALDGKRAIIVMEDIDSIILNVNRSEFLNVLDGINMKSGIYFIGTTNYINRIDSAFVNRSGRFDRSYKIDNPSNKVREEYFKMCNIDNILSNYKIANKSSDNYGLSIIDLFVKYSEGLSMANLKELIISTKYRLISDSSLTIDETVSDISKILIESISNKNNEDSLSKKQISKVFRNMLYNEEG